MIPASMLAESRHLIWKFGPEGKKLPYDWREPSGRPIDATDEQYWTTYDNAQTVVDQGQADGVGFALGDGWTGVDLDACRNPETAELTPDAHRIVDELNSYTDISVSGRGAHIYCRAYLGRNYTKPGLEIYTCKRYFCLTGQHLEGTPTTVEARGDQLAALIDREFVGADRDTDRVKRSAPRASIPDDDGESELIEGGRNNTLAKIAGRFRREGLDDDEMIPALMAINQKRCRPMLEPREVRAIARSIGRYPTTPDGFSLSETGDAECFADLYGDRVRFDHRRGLWLVASSDGLWNYDRVKELERLVVDLMRERQRRAEHLKGDDKKKLWTWAHHGESRKRITNTLALAQAIQPIADSGAGWDQHAHLLGVHNGVVDLRSGELRAADADERITMRAGCDYDPAARSDLWESALEQIFPHAGLTEFVQVLFGYSATGETKFDKWILGTGGGRNGKGTVYGAVRAALGDYSLELPASIFDIRKAQEYDLAKLPGRRFVSCSESGDTLRLNHDRIKQISGGDPLRAADKYEKSFEFNPVCKLWLACNKKPKATDDTVAFWARVILIPFTASFLGKENVELRPTLEKDPAERRAVLAWIVRGARRYYEHGIGSLPAIVRTAVDDYKRESEPLAPFYDACCVIGPDLKVQASALFAAYTRWAGVRVRFNVKTFGLEVRKRFDADEKRTVWYLGLAIRESFLPGDDENDARF